MDHASWYPFIASFNSLCLAIIHHLLNSTTSSSPAKRKNSDLLRPQGLNVQLGYLDAMFMQATQFLEFGELMENVSRLAK
jgi:hypothetical protein